jgi:hypothetical protein
MILLIEMIAVLIPIPPFLRLGFLKNLCLKPRGEAGWQKEGEIAVRGI